MAYIWILTTAFLTFSGDGPNLSPKLWGALEELEKADAEGWNGIPLTTSSKAMVITTSYGGTSTKAGLEALKQGGSAMDAALTTAFTEIALNMGSWSSYAGIMSVVYYDAASGEIHSATGGWKIPAAEKAPLTIPLSSERNERGFPVPGKRTGRGILVPGFMACAQATHKRFGKLPWATLFQPAIYFAEEGRKFSPMHQFLINAKKEVLQRFPETWAIFSKPNGEDYKLGDVFKQKALAHTLRAVAKNGADYMYSGPWGQDLVKAVREEGGNLTMNDLKIYKTNWTEPVRVKYGPFEVVGSGFPNMGGIHTVEAFNMLNLAKPTKKGPYWENGESLYYMIQISRMAAINTLAPQRYGFDPKKLFGKEDFSPTGRLKRSTAKAMWRRMKKDDWSQALQQALMRVPESGSHSDTVLAIDERGNAVALTHSINVANWGNSGIFVGGIGVSDAGRYQRASMSKSGPGSYLPEATNPLIVLKKGRPVMASGAVGRGLHEVTIQSLINMMDLDMNPKEAIDAPKFLTPQYDPQSKTPDTYYIQRLVNRGFSEEVLKDLKARGQEVLLQEPGDFKAYGYWLGLLVDHRTGDIQASGTMGGARGY